ncbi:DICT sensory domain-containing protein [Halovivax limisalsi]|uniref:DICT sensory domain-containing protein n=1 Tax=Halovivax limisalsi TaxID=1453760 RepID=UPI001FFD1135|nr:DICT sensory domain-containing protein [Halovivax limisalsi]
MSLRSFVDRDANPTTSLAVVAADDDPLGRMIGDVFETQTIEVEFRSDLDVDGDALVAIRDDEIVATSPMTAVYEDLLAVNSDLYVTGTRDLEAVSVPDAILALADSRFELRGYPLAHKEKFVLIAVSRYIERLAWNAGHGTLRSAFQDLGRIEDEHGTRSVYERLAGTDVDVHCYGFEGTSPDPLTGSGPDAPAITVHTGSTDEHRHSWFVVFRPASDERSPAALLALEAEPRIWRGFWTRDPDRVERIDDYIAEAL